MKKTKTNQCTSDASTLFFKHTGNVLINNKIPMNFVNIIIHHYFKAEFAVDLK